MAEVVKTGIDEIGIRKTPGVCGGEACVRHTRIPVRTLISWRLLGAPDAELLYNYSSSVSADLTAARAYYDSNTEEIDSAIRLNDEA